MIKVNDFPFNYSNKSSGSDVFGKAFEFKDKEKIYLLRISGDFQINEEALGYKNENNNLFANNWLQKIKL